jgi:hypothetical protein
VADRIASYEAAILEEIPGAFEVMDEMRAERGRGLPDWPSWCLVPMAGAIGVATHAGALDVSVPESLGIVDALSTLYAWRQGRTIWRFDPELVEALFRTSGGERIPPGILRRLPEWGIYVDWPEIGPSVEWAGVFVHLEHDANTGRGELRLTFDLPGGKLLAVPVHLGYPTLADALASADEVARSELVALAKRRPLTDFERDILEMRQPRASLVSSGALVSLAPMLEPVLGLVLYICSEGADIADPDDPAWRPMRRTHTPAKRTRQVAVGYRVATALRHARVGGAGRGGTHASPAAHLRRAHWHHYWVGPRGGERRLELRWIPPVAVGALPDTVGVRRVKG